MSSHARDLQQEAVDDLTYAFEHCPRGAEVNKARCAYYLVPARMLLGDLPRQAMLQRFNLHHYVPIVEVGFWDPMARVIVASCQEIHCSASHLKVHRAGC